MNSKLLLAATVALSMTSGLSMADEVNQPLTRAQVVSQLNQAAAAGTLLRSDADFANVPLITGSNLTRAEVAAEVAAARANGTLLTSDADFAWVTTPSSSTVTRAAVKAEVRDAIANGTLPRSESDFDKVYAAGHFNGQRSL